MADLVVTGSTGISISADEISTGVFTQRVKVVHGPDNSGTDVSTASGMPVTMLSSGGTYVTFNSNGSQTAANSAPVVQATDTSFAYSASGTFYSTTAASTYAANDVYGSTASGGSTNLSAVFALGAPSAGRIMITSASILTSTSATEATAWTLQLYNAAPPSNIADNGAFDIASGDRASYLGPINLGTPTDVGSSLYAEVNGINKQVKLSGTGVYGYLTNNSSSTVITTADHVVTLHAVSV